MTGASTSMARFTSQVGAGSKSQCLHGARDISCDIKFENTE